MTRTDVMDLVSLRSLAKKNIYTKQIFYKLFIDELNRRLPIYSYNIDRDNQYISLVLNNTENSYTRNNVLRTIAESFNESMVMYIGTNKDDNIDEYRPLSTLSILDAGRIIDVCVLLNGVINIYL